MHPITLSRHTRSCPPSGPRVFVWAYPDTLYPSPSPLPPHPGFIRTLGSHQVTDVCPHENDVKAHNSKSVMELFQYFLLLVTVI